MTDINRAAFAQSSTKLFDRYCKITVADASGAGIEITDLRMKFNVTKTIKPQPNKAEVTIYNLNPDHRKAIAAMQTAGVQIDAGYAGGSSTIFLGGLRTNMTVREGPNLLTALASGDGEVPYQQTRVKLSFARGSTADQVFKALAKALGVDQKPGSAVTTTQTGKTANGDVISSTATRIGLGNLDQAVATLKANFGDNARLFSMGTVVSGSASREMTRLCRALDLDWSIQNGKLQILPRGKALEGQAIFLSKLTGMIGVPTLDLAAKGKKAQLTVRSLLQPDVSPGRLIVLDAENLKGQFRVIETQHSGDTHAGADWQVTMKCERY